MAATFEFSEAGDALRTDAALASGQITVPRVPGVYRLVLIVKDIGSERTGTEDTSVKVPTFEWQRIGKAGATTGAIAP